MSRTTGNAMRDAEARGDGDQHDTAEVEIPRDDLSGVSTDGLRFEVRVLVDTARRQLDHIRARLSELADRAGAADAALNATLVDAHVADDALIRIRRTVPNA